MPSDKRFGPSDLQKLIEQMHPGASPELLAALFSGVGAGAPDALRPPEPQLHPVPETTRGFRIRIDLLHTKPPVWRRIEVPGDITLPLLHDVLQAAMGWTDSHLHRFRMGNERHAPRVPHPLRHGGRCGGHARGRCPSRPDRR